MLRGLSSKQGYCGVTLVSPFSPMSRGKIRLLSGEKGASLGSRACCPVGLFLGEGEGEMRARSGLTGH